MTINQADAATETETVGSSRRVDDGETITDFDLHGIIRLRLIDARQRDIRTVARQLGPIEAPVAGDADITVRFVDELRVRGTVRIVGLDEGAFSDDAFLILRSKHKARARVAIPLERVGSGLEIVCERGVSSVPQLIPIVNLTALAKGTQPLHAAAFEWNGVGVASCGWSKGGKTESLLAFMREGARYVGDEWVYVTGDGRSLYGIPEPIRLWDWHLGQLPEYRRLVPPADRVRLGAIGAAAAVHRSLPRDARRLPGSHAFDRMMALLEGQRHVDPPAERLFGRDRWAERTNFDRLFFLVNGDVDRVVVRPIDPEEVARRMTFSHVHHRIGFLNLYWQFRYAFPDRPNPIVEQVEGLERDLLRRVFAGKTAFEVLHPHPVAIPSLFDAISPHLG